MAVLKDVRHEKYVHNRLNGMTIDNAYVAAGFKRNRSNAARMNAYEHIQARMAELAAPAVKETEATVGRVLREMTRLAFYDMTGVITVEDDRLTLRDPTKLPDDLRHAITGIKPVETSDGTRQYECRFADKQKALDSLARHLQMFKDTVVVENVFRVVSEMDDDELDRRIAELERSLAEASTLDPAGGEGSASIH